MVTTHKEGEALRVESSARQTAEVALAASEEQYSGC